MIILMPNTFIISQYIWKLKPNLFSTDTCATSKLTGFKMIRTVVENELKTFTNQ